ncbi:MAG TPA: hypothetical protein VH479_17525 [Acidimicrobiales bacterium]|jgi:hypothetical protein
MAARRIEPELTPAAAPPRARAHRADEEQALPSPDVLRVAGPATASSVIERLQRTAGNRAVQRAMGPPVVVSRADDTTTTSISETTDTGNKYTQDLVLNKTKATIQVQLGINWVKAGTWASDADFKAFVQAVKNAAYSYLDNKFKIVCSPAGAAAALGLPDIELPISFVLYDYATGYTIQAHGGAPGGRSAMAQAGGNVYEQQTDGTKEIPITFAHEFGHAALGASDEYANPAVPGRVLTNDHSIMANYYQQGIPQAQFKARHFQHLVAEVAKAFAGYTCSLRSM